MEMGELVGENQEYRTWLKKNEKYAYHAYCVHKKTGMTVEQASQTRANAIHMAQAEMNFRLKEEAVDEKP